MDAGIHAWRQSISATPASKICWATTGAASIWLSSPDACGIVAERLALSCSALEKVVLIHELGHAVSHLGTDRGGASWHDYHAATSEDKEFFAQLCTYAILLRTRHVRLLEAFMELSAIQRLKYNSWQGHRYDGPDRIRSSLQSVRE